MRNLGNRTFRTLLLGVISLSLPIGLMGTSCGGGAVLSLTPFPQISAVQLFDEPAFTMALSVSDAVNNPGAVTKVNWVFGDGGGFVEGAAEQTSITHQYASAGTYQVTAYIFGPDGFLDQVDGTITVFDNGGGNNTGGGTPTVEPPAAASGFVPVNSAIDVAVTTKLKWVIGARATSHDVYLGTDLAAVTAATHSDAAIFKGSQTTTSFTPATGSILGDTTYYWRIDEVNSAGTTAGAVVSFKTVKPPLKATDPVPAHNSVSARVNQVLSWTAGTRATSHDVYFGKDLAAVGAATKETLSLFKGNQTTTNFDPSDEDSAIPANLLPSTIYYWRIDEVGTGGTTHGDVWIFTTKAPPPAVTNPDPADMAINVAVTKTLSWDGDSTIESYDVYFGTADLDVTLASKSSPEFKGNQTTKNFSPTPQPLDPSKTYFWRIDTLGAGGTSKGATFRFTTDAQPAIATNFCPIDNATGLDVHTTDLSWSPGVGGTINGYDVYLSTDQTAVNTLAQSAFKVNLPPGSVASTACSGSPPAGTTLYHPPTDLLANTFYYWRIVSKGPGGSKNGPVLTFRTGILAGAASNPNPVINATGITLDVTLKWMRNRNGATSVTDDVYLGTNQTDVTNATDQDAAFQGHGIDDGDVDHGKFHVTFMLQPGTDYFWRIDERASGGVTKGTVWKFTTMGKPTGPIPTNGAVGQDLNVDIQWSGGTGNVKFDVYFGTDLANVTNASRAAPMGVLKAQDQVGTAYDPGLLPANTDHYWRIDGISTDGSIAKGDVWTFKTLAAPAQAANPNPGNNATNVSVTPTLSWNSVQNATGYDVYFDGALVSTNQPGTSYIPGALNHNQTYTWRVDPRNAAGTTTGITWSFTTAP